MQDPVTAEPTEGPEPRSIDALRHAVDEAARLLQADGAIAYLLEPDGKSLRWVCDAGISASDERTWMRAMVLPLGVGMVGQAAAERAVRITHDYPGDQSFPHAWMTDQVARGASIRSMAVAPLVADDKLIGALGVYSGRPSAFGEAETSLVKALADHAAASLANARLIEQLARSQTELGHRAEQERTLREISGRIAILREPADVLQQVVDESRRLLAADGAHLCLMAESGTYLTPVVLAGGTDADTERWLRAMQFPVGDGINGLAAVSGRAVWTSDYLVDERIPHEPQDQLVAERMGLRAMASAPLLGQGGEVIGTLAVSYARPRDLETGALELLQGLADQAAIAVANSRLYAELRQSEERYRYLLRHSPDVAWSADQEGRFTFVSDVVERLSGWTASEVLGRPFGVLVHADSGAAFHRAWERLSQPPHPDQEVRFMVPARDGHAIPAELRAVAMVDGATFLGAHGLIRDLRGQVRLEQDLGRQAAELASAQERTKLAQELHDSVTQALFSMTLTTRSIELLVERDPAQALARIAELRELEREALAEMRALIFELRPGNLEEDGLVQALRTHAAGVQGRSGLPIAVECDALEPRPSLVVETALYRIAQEALHNVVKHANATSVRLSLRRTHHGLRLSIDDDGGGFDLTDVPTGHLGLVGMRARATNIGAQITIRSEPGAGTGIEVIVPYHRLQRASATPQV